MRVSRPTPVPRKTAGNGVDGLVTARDRCVAQVAGRTADTDITMFKSVGAAVEDLCAAIALYQRATAQDGSGGSTEYPRM